MLSLCYPSPAPAFLSSQRIHHTLACLLPLSSLPPSLPLCSFARGIARPVSLASSWNHSVPSQYYLHMLSFSCPCFPLLLTHPSHSRLPPHPLPPIRSLARERASLVSLAYSWNRSVPLHYLMQSFSYPAFISGAPCLLYASVALSSASSSSPPYNHISKGRRCLNSLASSGNRSVPSHY